MNKFYSLVLAISITMPNTFADDHHVGTEPQQASVLLEEFTGINCGYCPQGHQRAASMLLAQPDKVNVIAVHAGYYAVPLSDQPDFRTDEGEDLCTSLQVSGFPSGTINRRDYGNSIVLSRGIWPTSARQAVAETAAVNLWCEASYDNATRNLAINVEGYCVEMPENGVRLGVALVQNNITGPQSGGLVGDEYNHMHMLRAYLTDLWGDDIEEAAKGEYFTRNYNYTLPEAIKDAAVDPLDIEVIVFAANGNTAIDNSLTCLPQCTGLERGIDVDIAAYKIPIKKNYGFDFIELYLTNNSTQPVTEASFDLTYNDQTESVSWNGNVEPRSKQLIKIQAPSLLENQTESNTYSVVLTGINGEEASAPTTVKGTFGALTPASEKVKIKIRTDNYASDNSYRLLDSSGNLITEFGPYANGEAAIYEEEAEIEMGKIYCFEIEDAWGDGIITPRGYFKLYDSNDNLIGQQLEIDDHGYRLFVEVSDNASTNNISADSQQATVSYDSATGILTVGSCSKKSETEVWNSAGILAATGTGACSIDLQNVTPGIYMVRVIESTSVTTSKIAVR